MRIKFGSIITAGSGKLGGHVVTKNNSIPVLQTKGSARSKGKNFGILGQGIVSLFSTKWRTLSDPQRLSWSVGSAGLSSLDVLGNKITLSGYALYIRNNCYAKMANLPFVGSFLSPSVSYSPPYLNMSFAVTGNVMYSSVNGNFIVGSHCLVYFQKKKSSYHSLNDNNWKFLSFGICDPAFYYFKDSVDYAKAGITLADDLVFFKFIIVDSGGFINFPFIGQAVLS